jgi:hypothetical protein
VDLPRDRRRENIGLLKDRKREKCALAKI